jgi:hypothetical protein
VWYKSIYEMHPSDKPEDKLIEDDEALDKWFDAYLKDVARKSARPRGGSINGGNPEADRERARRINVFGPQE